MIIAVTPYEILNDRHIDRLVKIEPWINGVIIRVPMSHESLKKWLGILMDKGFPKQKVIIHTNILLAQEMGMKRIHFSEYQLPKQLDMAYWEVSMSIHSQEMIRKIKQTGVRWGLFGHLYMSRSKPGKAPRTFKEVNDALREDFPLVGIGGINVETIAHVPKAFQGVAMIDGAFNQDVKGFLKMVQKWNG
ncbi:thiamine phosphate synthase [Staphylococcus ratti]|uniref:Thiamine phosphate synthase n=1 Tax=Staphylococcus ratti TaxID=2892440 RepID=A0ABY3PC67_9STAP|nr:thiamine phosphate synthase [Staphylococcus ratti]UEX89818.1 thiamine phosphate synthase [Staphylococcus ratti]